MEQRIYYCVEYRFWRDDGWDCYDYTSRGYSRKVTLEDVFEFKKKEPFQTEFRLYEEIVQGLFPPTRNYSPWIVFDERFKSKDNLTISEASYLFESGQDLIKKLEQ